MGSLISTTTPTNFVPAAVLSLFHRMKLLPEEAAGLYAKSDLVVVPVTDPTSDWLPVESEVKLGESVLP